MAGILGFSLDTYPLDTPGFDGPAQDLMSIEGKISKDALQAAQAYFRHVVPQVLRSPDKRLIMMPSHLAAIHPEIAKFVLSGGRKSICHCFASTENYDFRWHSDSQVCGLHNRFLMVYGQKRIRVMPFENLLAWPDTGPRVWVELDGEPKRGIVGEGAMADVTQGEGDMFTMKGLNLHHLSTTVNDDGLSLMIACHSFGLNPHPYAWIPAANVWQYGGVEIVAAFRLLYSQFWQPGGFSSGGNGDGAKSRVPANHDIAESPHTVHRDVLHKTIAQATKNLWKQFQSKEHIWNIPPEMGPGFDVMYYFTLAALSQNGKSRFDNQEFTEFLLASQRTDGTWDQVHDSLSITGDLDTTILAYWYLKSVCEDDSCKRSLERAKSAILQLGGVWSAQTMTKVKLATFGHFPWKELKHIPLVIFQNRTAFHRIIRQYTFDKTAQWVPQHLLPMAYLIDQQIVFSVGKDIQELFDQEHQVSYRKMRGEIRHRVGTQSDSDKKYLDPDVHGILKEILNGQEPLGSFGAYTVATEMSLLVLKDFQLAFPEHARSFLPQIKDATHKGLQFLERAKLVEAGPTKYRGPVMDGRWWDTLLVSWALLEAGVDPFRLNQTAALLVSDALQPNGGVCYGRDFDYAPDTDDTSIFVMLMQRMGGVFKSKAKKSRHWLETMQNTDGGFPAFHTGKNPFWSLQKAFEWTGVADSAEIFDVSCADLTGHVLEALGTASDRYTVNHPVVVKAIDYLKATQSPFGGWQGRWGVNYIYAIGAVIPGLKSVGVNLREPWIVKAFTWLLDHQNADGGFGESLKSYDSKLWAGIGKSTVTQTAWALLALLEAPQDVVKGLNTAVDHAALFLLDSFRSNRAEFEDGFVVGTGHRAIVNLQYTAYAKTFPLIALARYRKLRFLSSEESFLSPPDLVPQQFLFDVDNGSLADGM